jgi:CHASE2 domain-containing sensor protein/two-component sensor histidine kinase
VWRNRQSLLILLFAWIFALCCQGLGWLQPLELNLYDFNSSRRHVKGNYDKIVIVKIDESDIEKFNWPLSDRLLAQLLEKIKVQQPIAIGLDIYRNVPVSPGSQEIAAIFNSTPNLLGIEKVLSSYRDAKIPPNPILKRKKQIASSDIPAEPDDKIRRGLLIPYATDDPDLPSLSLAMAWKYLATQQIFPERGEGDWLKLNNFTFFPFNKSDGGYVNVDDGSYQILIDFAGGAGAFAEVSISEVLLDKLPADTFQNKLVLIGSTAPSLNDIFSTPQERMAGIEIHAHLTSQIISSALTGKSYLNTVPDSLEVGYLLLCGLISHWLIYRNLRLGKKLLFLLLCTLIIILVIAVISYLGFGLGYWIPVLATCLAVFIDSIILIPWYQFHQLDTLNKQLTLTTKELDVQLAQNRQLCDTLAEKVIVKEKENQELYEQLSLEQKLAGLGRVMGAINHEIKNPLHFIVNLSNSMLSLIKQAEEFDDSLLAELQEATQRIKQQSARINSVIENVLLYSHPHVGDISKFNLNELIQDAIESAYDEILTKFPDLNVKTEVEFDFEVAEFTSNMQIVQIIMNNLIGNALYSAYQKADDAPIIKVTTQRQPNQSVMIKVMDNGVGIEAESLNKIFEPFYTTKPLGEGNGLGLWLVYQFIKQLKGRITVESSLGEYTTFVLYIPQSVQ